MNQRTENFLLHSFVISAFIISLYTFIITPFTGDLYVLLAGSHQAEMLGGNIITNPLMQWDLKGAFFRLALFIIYRCVSPWVKMAGTGTEFCTAVNIVFCALVIALIAFSVIIANGIKEGRKNFLVILALCTGIFASLPQSHMQTEMICTVKLIFAFSLYINAQRTKTFFRAKLFLSGFLAAEIVFYKSIFALMAVPFAAGIYLYDRKNNYTLPFRQFMFIFSGGLTAVIIVMAVILYVNPNEIQNMLDAAAYQPPIFRSTEPIFNSLFRFMKSSALALLTIPAILIGLVYGVGNFSNDIRRKDYVNIILRLVLWFIPALMIIIADRYFIYHFFILSAVSILEICLAIRKKNKAALLFLIISGGIYMCFLSPFSFYIRESTRLIKETYSESMTTLSSLNIDPSEPIMYLDDGFGAYLIGNKSWIDEYYVLPLQRLREESDNESHVKALKKALAYDGRFLTVFDSWFFKEGNNQKLKEKISREYQKKGELPMYTFSTNIFKRPTREGIPRIIDIYERIVP